MFTSSSQTRPCFGFSAPETTRNSVVLPDPLGPRTPTRPPDGIVNETCRRIGWPPSSTETSSHRSMIGLHRGREVDGPAAAVLHVFAMNDGERRSEERAPGHDRVIFTALA